MHINTADVYVFNKVAKVLSFTIAAREIGASRSAISKKITRLERNLGVILLNRSTRSVSLTEAGRILLEHTLQVDTIIERAVNDVRIAELEPTGTVKISMPSSFGTTLMPSLITKFQQSWPDVKIDIHVEDSEVDLIAGGYDVAIRVSHKLKDSSLISRRLGSTRRVLGASPAYLKQFGRPHSLHDLKKHRCLRFSSGDNHGTSWRFNTRDKKIEISCTFPITTNNSQVLIDAACRNEGILYVPQAYISNELEQKRLEIILLGSHVPVSYGIFAIYPHRNAAVKVKVLVDFVERELNTLNLVD